MIRAQSVARQRRRATGLAALLVATMPAGPALAQQAAKPQVDGEKILDLLVAKGVISQSDADGIIAQATVPPASGAASPAVVAGGVTGDTQTIPYIPETVRNQIKNELRQEVTAQAKSEGWATPGEIPEWTRRITLYGDLRVRGEGDHLPNSNFNQFPNFNSINSGSGFDLNGITNAPFLNTTADRYRPRLRARLGLKADVASWISADIRLATGNDNSPVSTNQTLGGNGYFSKYSIWLDRADIRFTPLPGLKIDFGRFANPFWTTDLLFDPDLNFDGVAVQYRREFADRGAIFGSIGAFPLYNTDFNFGTTDTVKTKSRDKYLAAAQLGVQYNATDTLKLSLAASYYHFGKAEGALSSPCLPPTSADSCDTDTSRPQFVQFGNTLFPIRNIIPDADNPNGAQLQYFGLASKFHVFDEHGQIDYQASPGFLVRAEGDYVRNLAYDANRIRARGPVNNLGNNGVYAGGGIGWYANLAVGKPDLAEAGDWTASIGYKHLDSDAVLDGLTDSDFHLGGTNAKGFIVGAGYALAHNTSISARYLSADQITGPPYAADVIQIDLNTKF